MTNNEESSPTNIVRARAGTTRGVRLWPDPDGIFFCPFIEQGQQLGYIFVYGEGSPAVFDGKEWHSILSDENDWADMQDLVVDQYRNIVFHAEKNPAYKVIADRLVSASAYAG